MMTPAIMARIPPQSPLTANPAMGICTSFRSGAEDTHGTKQFWSHLLYVCRDRLFNPVDFDETISGFSDTFILFEQILKQYPYRYLIVYEKASIFVTMVGFGVRNGISKCG